MDENVAAVKQKAASAALFFFAFVGFIASIVAIVSYLYPAQSGVLRVEITPNDFRIPLEVAQPFAESSPARTMAADFKKILCAPPKKAPVEANKPASQQTSTESDCEQAGDIDWVARWSYAFATSPGTLYQYEIKNLGSGIAEKIRISGKDVASLQIKRGTKFLDIQPDKNDEFYDIPDLNPHEEVEVLIWMDGVSLGFLDYSDAPVVTFAGASVKKEIMRRVPENWWNIYDTFGHTSAVMLIVFVIGASFLVTISVVLVISIIVAVVQGRPIKSVFEPPAKSKPEGE
ncbi:MAG: hypothetical protein R3E11_06430 [Sphingobium sp.]|nr:hypothetical protein [Sphingobium sp.]MCP5399145.1 hypothetical protein [Sphingomonas sp.]